MKYWNTKLKVMTEYIPGEQPVNLEEYIKLNTNENPFPPSDVVLQSLKEECNESLRLYPSPSSDSIRNLFASENHLNPNNIFIGNGSDEIFTLIFRGFIETNRKAAIPYPSYSLYYSLAEANGITYYKIPLNKELDIDLNDYLNKTYDLVIISNPNNPTGRGCKYSDVKNFLDKFKGLLIVDEAYVDFYGETIIDLVKEYDNIIVTRSFSKSYSLAGLRIGIAVANDEIIRGFMKLKDSYNVDRLAQTGARAALLDKKGLKYNIDMIRNNKEYLEEKLEELGFHVVPSKANFLFVKHEKVLSKEIFEFLKKKKILVRFFEGPVQSDYIRITVGKMSELKTLISELSSILEA